MQTFEAVHDLHSLGFLHRDLSPAKFVLGLDNPQLVYLVGFSMAFHFQPPADSKPSASPRRLPKMAARSFLSRGYHRAKEMHRKDDLESWLFVCFNLFGRRVLPWNEACSDLDLYSRKERLFCDGFEECYEVVPREFQTIAHNLDKLAEGARPDYTFIATMLAAVKSALKFSLDGPFDWQKKEAVADKEEGDRSLVEREEKRTPRQKPLSPQGKKTRSPAESPEESEAPPPARESPRPPAEVRPSAARLILRQMDEMRKQNEQLSAKLDALAAKKKPAGRKETPVEDEEQSVGEGSVAETPKKRRSKRAARSEFVAKDLNRDD
ncbi:hypothetical protein M3Y99_01562500 [Aphelenchoides fujianensis]|nr:hypothetical protein M3Y99_01562500 [Aphelenchoides fujianensis]